MKAFMEFTGGTEGTSEDLVLCIDVSPSMTEGDYKPSRIEGAKEAACALIRQKASQAPHDRVGLVTFSRSGRRELGLTTIGSGASVVMEAIGRIEIGSYTNLASGLTQAKRVLESSIDATTRTLAKTMRFLFHMGAEVASEPRSRRILVLTDGCHNHGPEPLPVARAIKESGTLIDVIGIGGDPSEVDEKLLRQVASDRPDGSPRYWFIRDSRELVKRFEELATNLRVFGKEAA